MPLFWTSIENQERVDGSRAVLWDHYNDYSEALAKHFTICATASKSGLPYHSSTLLQSDGRVVKQEIFDRRVVPEPEPEPAPVEG